MAAGRRRALWLAAPVTAVLLAGIAVVVVRLVWLPGYRPALHPGERLGIDVSSFQGRNIDWQAVAGDGIRFVYVKATEGTGYVDPDLAADWAGAGAAGLARGAYHFFTLCSSGRAQARAFTTALGGRPAELPPAVDLELIGTCAARPPAPAVARNLSVFLRYVGRATGRPVVLYLGGDFAHRYPLALEQRAPLWLRRLARRPAGQWVIWQANDDADVAGVPGGVDLDVARQRLPSESSQPVG